VESIAPAMDSRFAPIPRTFPFAEFAALDPPPPRA
jgi:hypothetical protein